MRTRAFLLLLLLLLSAAVVAAQDDAPSFDLTTRLRDAADVQTLLDAATFNVEPFDVFTDWNNSSIRALTGATIAPDAGSIAWHGQITQNVTTEQATVICVYTIETVTSNCLLLPDDGPESIGVLDWSPDARLIVFTEDRARARDESDIWVYQVQPQALVNLTPDGVSGSRFETATALVDFAPVWHPTDGSLYFLRDAAPGGLAPLFDLYRLERPALDAVLGIAAERIIAQNERPDVGVFTGEATPEVFDPNTLVEPTPEPELPLPSPQLLASLAGFPINTTFPETTREMFNGAASIDPNGFFLALALNSSVNPPDSGVMLVDLSSFEIIPVLTLDLFTEYTPEWIESAEIRDLAWSGDGGALVVSVWEQGRSAAYHSLFLYNTTTGRVVPMISFADVLNESLFFGGEAPFIAPDSAVLLPEGALVYFNRSSRDTLNAIDLDTPDMLQRLPIGRNLSTENRFPSSAGVGEDVIRLLLDTNLITLSR